MTTSPLSKWPYISDLTPYKFWRAGMRDIDGNQIVLVGHKGIQVLPWVGHDRWLPDLELVLEDDYPALTLADPDPNHAPNIAYLEADVAAAHSVRIVVQEDHDGWTWREEHTPGYRPHHSTKIEALLDALTEAPAALARKQIEKENQAATDGFPPGWGVFDGGEGEWWVLGPGSQSSQIFNTREAAVAELWAMFGTSKERWERFLAYEIGGASP